MIIAPAGTGSWVAQTTNSLDRGHGHWLTKWFWDGLLYLNAMVSHDKLTWQLLGFYYGCHRGGKCMSIFACHKAWLHVPCVYADLRAEIDLSPSMHLWISCFSYLRLYRCVARRIFASFPWMPAYFSSFLLPAQIPSSHRAFGMVFFCTFSFATRAKNK